MPILIPMSAFSMPFMGDAGSRHSWRVGRSAGWLYRPYDVRIGSNGNGEFEAVADTELAKYLIDMGADGVVLDAEHLRDADIVKAVGDECRHRTFPCREGERVADFD